MMLDLCDVEKKWSPRFESVLPFARVRVKFKVTTRARREYSEFDYSTLDYCEMRGMRDQAARAKKATTRMPTATTS